MGAEGAGGRIAVNLDDAAGGLTGVLHVVIHREAVFVTEVAHQRVCRTGGQCAVLVHHGGVAAPRAAASGAERGAAAFQRHVCPGASVQTRRGVAAVGPGDRDAGGAQRLCAGPRAGEGHAGGAGGVFGNGVVAAAHQTVACRVITGGPVGPGHRAAAAGRTGGVDHVKRRGAVGFAARKAAEDAPQGREIHGPRRVVFRHGVSDGDARRSDVAVIRRAAAGVPIRGGIGEAGPRAGRGGRAVNFYLVGVGVGDAVVYVVINRDAEAVTGAVGEVGGGPVVGARARVGVEAREVCPAAIGSAGACGECGRLIIDEVRVACAASAVDTRRRVGARVIGDGHRVVVGGGVAPLVGVTHVAAGGGGGVFHQGIVGGRCGAVARVVGAGGAVGPGHGVFRAEGPAKNGVGVGVGAGGVGAAAGDAAKHASQAGEGDIGHAAGRIGGGVFGDERAPRRQRAVIHRGGVHPHIVGGFGGGADVAGGGHRVYLDNAAVGLGGVLHVVVHREAVFITVAAHQGVRRTDGQGAVLVHHGGVTTIGPAGAVGEGGAAAFQRHVGPGACVHPRRGISAVGPGDGDARGIERLRAGPRAGEGHAGGASGVFGNGVVARARQTVSRRVITGGSVGPGHRAAAAGRTGGVNHVKR